jgi:hypothetical protein
MHCAVDPHPGGFNRAPRRSQRFQRVKQRDPNSHSFATWPQASSVSALPRSQECADRTQPVWRAS